MSGTWDTRKGLLRPVMVLAQDAGVLAATDAAARHARRPPVVVMRSGREALARLVAPDARGGHLVCDPATAGAAWPHLLRTFAGPSMPTALVLVGESGTVPPAGVVTREPCPARLHAALHAAKPRPSRPGAALPRDAAGALRRAIGRGAILVSYQPVVGVSDRRPLLIEALARWPYRRRLIDPSAFVPLAERAGLAEALASAVAKRIALDAAAEFARLPLGVSLNLPLEVVLRPSLVGGLRQAFARSGLRPSRLAIELTETAREYDRALLRRALLRLRRAGHRVLLDDVHLDDPRRPLFGLPFAGLKLDRSVTERLPHSFAARLGVRRLVAAAQARGQQVIAEGVSDARLWALVRALKVHGAQGWLVGRPIPAAALAVWREGWRRGRRGA